jgi:serine/threonine-protein kinase
MENMPLADHVTDRAEARIGSVLRGKWKLERIVGVGGMATVYAATHRNKSRVAIKVLHPELAIDAEVTARFLREGYVANAVDHPGTVKVIDDDLTEDGAPFLVMELLDGETLDARLTRKGRLDVGEVLAIANQVLAVLEAAHERGVVHRDLKPENLFLTRQGELKILDFGIARLRELTPDGSSTRAGSLLGTPAFMAPEQARGRWDDVDARTDIWAVGATIFSLLTGHRARAADQERHRRRAVFGRALAGHQRGGGGPGRSLAGLRPPEALRQRQADAPGAALGRGAVGE